MARTSNPTGRVTWVLRFAALLVVAASGCSRGTEMVFAPVEGTVTRNGKPIPHAQVIFLGDEGTVGPRASGVTDEKGRYRLAADDGTEGAPVGRHRVCVVDTTLAAERLGLSAKQLPPETAEKLSQLKGTGRVAAIPASYGRPTQTPLRAEVRAGSQTIDFQVQ